MSNVVIKAENISKYYRLGELGSGSLKQDLKYWWEKRFSPKNGSIVSEYDNSSERKEDHIWALRNINFEVSQGEVLGFIGKNGAGKSTLLKLLSRITLPTTGSIKGKGRIASLLEVGTGFHSELTGRENIFLNGQILGMRKREVAARFDEIVDFSGIEKFIDTPVKRYSSGMYVRLAFAVAAHLDPEILIVDEVLAVGDAEFQRKCLGKMKDVSKESGRTVLFVSHNLQALRNLCERAIFLENGQISSIGDPETVISNYLNKEKIQYVMCRQFDDMGTAPGNENIRIKKVKLIPQYVDQFKILDIRTPILIKFEFWCNTAPDVDLIVGITLFTISGDCIFDVASDAYQFQKGLVKGECLIPGDFLNDGSYYISIFFSKTTTGVLYAYEECLTFDVEDYRDDSTWFGKWWGYVRPKFKVHLQKES